MEYLLDKQLALLRDKDISKMIHWLENFRALTRAQSLHKIQYQKHAQKITAQLGYEAQLNLTCPNHTFAKFLPY